MQGVRAGGAAGGNRGYNTGNSYNRQTQGPPPGEVRFDNRGVRVHPVNRPFMDWNRPGRFFGRDPHFFGYRVSVLSFNAYLSQYFFNEISIFLQSLFLLA